MINNVYNLKNLCNEANNKINEMNKKIINYEKQIKENDQSII